MMLAGLADGSSDRYHSFAVSESPGRTLQAEGEQEGTFSLNLWSLKGLFKTS